MVLGPSLRLLWLGRTRCGSKYGTYCHHVPNEHNMGHVRDNSNTIPRAIATLLAPAESALIFLAGEMHKKGDYDAAGTRKVCTVPKMKKQKIECERSVVTVQCLILCGSGRG